MIALSVYLGMISSEEDKQKFEKLYELYQLPMLYVAQQIVHDPHDAEDVVSESFFKLLGLLEHINNVSSKSTKSYVSAIVRHTAIDFMRSNGKYKKTEDLDELADYIEDANSIPIDIIVSRQSYQLLLQEFGLLPEQYRDVMILRYVHDMNEALIAETLGLSLSNVKKRLERARIKLRNQLVTAGEAIK